MTGAETGHTDPGLQTERTTMAWVRTAASLAAVALLYLRYVPGPLAVTATIGGCAIAVSVGVVATGARAHRRRNAAFGGGRSVPEVTGNLTLAVLVAGMALSAGICIITD